MSDIGPTPRLQRQGRSHISDRRTDWQEAFLEDFAEHGVVRHACLAANVPRSTMYEHRARCPEFAAAFAEAEQTAADVLEEEAKRRAHDGVEKAVYYQGEVVGHVTEYSDRLLERLLEARRPERFRGNVKVEHSGAVTQNHRIDLARLSDEDLAEFERIAAQLEA